MRFFLPRPAAFGPLAFLSMLALTLRMVQVTGPTPNRHCEVTAPAVITKQDAKKALVFITHPPFISTEKLKAYSALITLIRLK